MTQEQQLIEKDLEEIRGELEYDAVKLVAHYGEIDLYYSSRSGLEYIYDGGSIWTEYQDEFQELKRDLAEKVYIPSVR